MVTSQIISVNSSELSIPAIIQEIKSEAAGVKQTYVKARNRLLIMMIIDSYRPCADHAWKLRAGAFIKELKRKSYSPQILELFKEKIKAIKCKEDLKDVVQLLDHVSSTSSAIEQVYGRVFGNNVGQDQESRAYHQVKASIASDIKSKRWEVAQTKFARALEQCGTIPLITTIVSIINKAYDECARSLHRKPLSFAKWNAIYQHVEYETDTTTLTISKTILFEKSIELFDSIFSEGHVKNKRQYFNVYWKALTRIISLLNEADKEQQEDKLIEEILDKLIASHRTEHQVQQHSQHIEELLHHIIKERLRLQTNGL